MRLHPLRDKLYVITVIMNPIRYESRWNLYHRFAREIKAQGAQLITVEARFGDRDFCVTEAGNPFHVQLQTYEELWHKENLINIAVSRIPDPNWKAVAWIDADITFIRPDIIDETMFQLDHYEVVQLFDTASDLGPQGETFKTSKGFISSYLAGATYPFDGETGAKYAHHWHSGYAWAMNREAFNKVGGLIDFSILGSADFQMAHGFCGLMERQVGEWMSRGYTESLRIWAARCEKYIKRDVGYVPGTIVHHWHGKKRDRRYNDRWKILRENNFDPEFDLKKDWQGVLLLEDDRVNLRDEIRGYFRSRNEDSTDFE